MIYPIRGLELKAISRFYDIIKTVFGKNPVVLGNDLQTHDIFAAILIKFIFRNTIKRSNFCFRGKYNIQNRALRFSFDINNEGDDVFIQNAEKLIKLLPENAKLGLYECPYPYKRLLTPKILRWCLSTGRFRFIKDTCCDSAVIKERLAILNGSELKLFNANCQTLLHSLRNGGSGYCGIMANYHPSLYVWLCHNYENESENAKLLQNFFTMSGFTEVGLPYPLTAKYHMCLEGIETELSTRKPDGGILTDYAKDCIRQMRALANHFKNTL